MSVALVFRASDAAANAVNSNSMNWAITSAIPSTWNPTYLSGVALTYTNGNKTADNLGASYGTTYSYTTKTTGKWYFEVRMDSAVGANEIRVGICDAAQRNASLVTIGVASPGKGWAYRPLGGNTENNGTSTGGATVGSAGQIVGVAVDVDAGKIWWAINNTWIASGNPAAGTNPRYSNVTAFTSPLYAAASLYIAGKVTGRFVTADFTYTPPTGFLEWG
jgi:hypothetical protein